jgi:hypothetical protein
MHNRIDQTGTEKPRAINRAHRTLGSIEVPARSTEACEVDSIASLNHLAALLAEAVDALKASPVSFTEDGG